MIDRVFIYNGLVPFKNFNVNSTFKALAQPFGGGPAFMTVVKDLPVRELFNELFAFLVLHELALPVPRSYVGFVDASLPEVSKAPPDGQGHRVVFASEEIPAPSLRFTTGLPSPSTFQEEQFLLDHIVPLISSWKGLGELYAFDEWVANVDRNVGNLLLGPKSTKSNPEVWLIDHGMAFTSPSWTAGELLPNADYLNKLSVWATPRLSVDKRQKCLAAAASFVAKAQNFDKDGKIEYLATVFGLSKEEREAAKHFLEVRIAQISDRSLKILGLEGMI